MTAQALSIVGFFISWGYGAIFGLVAFILLNVAWCCKMSKCGLIVAGVFACIAAAGTIGVGAYSLAVADDYYTDDYYYSSTTNTAYVTVGILGLIGGGIWITVATLVFIFVCGRRFRKYESSLDDANNKNQQGDDNLPVVTIPTTEQEPMKPVAVNHVKSVVPMARSTVVEASTTSKMNDGDDAESWASEAETVVDTERQSKKKSDGTTVDTEIQTFTHRDSTKSSVKTVRLSKELGDGSMKEKVTVIKTDKKGKESKTVETNLIPAETKV